MTYLSGKITGLDLDLANSNFESTRIKLFPTICVNPMNIEPMFGIYKWLFHMISDVIILSECSEIYMLANWKESKGARIELLIAKILRLKIRYEIQTK